MLCFPESDVLECCETDTAGLLYKAHMFDCLLVFLFDLDPYINLCSVFFSYVLVLILQFPHQVPLLMMVGRLCRTALDCRLSVPVMLVLLVFSVV